LPADVLSEAYQTEYGEAFVEVHSDSLCEGDSLLLVDDLLATGGTLIAAAILARRMGARVHEAAAIIDLPELGGSPRLRGAGIPTLRLTRFDPTEPWPRRLVRSVAMPQAMHLLFLRASKGKRGRTEASNDPNHSNHWSR